MTELREKLAHQLYLGWVFEHGFPNGLPTWEELPEDSAKRLAADPICKLTWRGIADFAGALIQKEQGWRDIESAPRDGTDILVFCEDSGEQFVGFNNPAEGSDREDVFFTALLKSGKRVGCIPSHWQPLPTPPQGEDG